MLSPAQWALRQFGGVRLGDERINKRVVSFAAAAAARPEASVPRQCGPWKHTKAAYRLMDNDKVSFEKLQQPHRRLTLAAAGEAKAVLWVSDTTTLSFEHPATEGLGPTSSKGNGSGMLLHSTLGVDVSSGGEAKAKARGTPKAKYRLEAKPGVLTRVARMVTGTTPPPARVDIPVPAAPSASRRSR